MEGKESISSCRGRKEWNALIRPCDVSRPIQADIDLPLTYFIKQFVRHSDLPDIRANLHIEVAKKVHR